MHLKLLNMVAKDPELSQLPAAQGIIHEMACAFTAFTANAVEFADFMARSNTAAITGT